MLDQVLQLLERALAGAGAARRLLAFWGPVATMPTVLAPFLAIGSVLTLALLTGIAVGALSTLILTLVVLYLVLTEVFGLTIDVNLA
jgi:hypothetical protein